MPAEPSVPVSRTGIVSLLAVITSPYGTRPIPKLWPVSGSPTTDRPIPPYSIPTLLPCLGCNRFNTAAFRPVKIAGVNFRLRAGCLERVWSRSPVAPVLRRRPGGVLAIWQSHFSPFISSIAPVAYVLHAFRGHSGSWQSGNLTSGKPHFFRAWNSGWNRGSMAVKVAKAANCWPPWPPCRLGTAPEAPWRCDDVTMLLKNAVFYRSK